MGVIIDHKKLKRIREKKGLFQHDLAAIVGYSPSRITQFERGHPGGVPLDSLKLIAKTLEIDFMELLPLETLKLVAEALGIDYRELLPEEKNEENDTT